jgi:hypothetical protein
MAELFGEELDFTSWDIWSIRNGWIGWTCGWIGWTSGWSGWSCCWFSPLASVVAIGSNISFDAFLNESDIIGDLHWGAEFMIWDQFFTVRPDAFWNLSASIKIS